MKLSLAISYAGGFAESAKQVAEYEKAGLDIAWVAEAYGFDAPSYMGYLAAKTETVQIGAGILPIYTRTPALLAMTAAGVDAMSDGRCILGLGASGPQVIEGWHGVPYTTPLARTREIIDICRKVWAREEPLTNDGPHYPLPLPAGQGTGLGKPLKIIGRPVRDRIPIWVASLGAKNVELTAEKADGWLPLFYLPEKAREAFGTALDAGAAKRDPQLGTLDICAGGMVAITEDEQQIRQLRDLARPMVALYVGGMGAKGKNFYNTLIRRYGFEQAADEIQDLYLAGKKDEAAAKVPDELLEGMNLIGPEGYVRDRLAAFRESGVTVLSITPVDPEPTKLIEKLKAWTS